MIKVLGILIIWSLNLADQEEQLLNDILPFLILDKESVAYDSIGYPPKPKISIQYLSTKYGMNYSIATYKEYISLIHETGINIDTADIWEWVDSRDLYNLRFDSVIDSYSGIAIVNEFLSNETLSKEREHIDLEIRDEHLDIVNSFFNNVKDSKPIHNNLFKSTGSNRIVLVDSIDSQVDNSYYMTLEFTRAVFDQKKKNACIYHRCKSNYTNDNDYGELLVLNKERGKWNIQWQYYFMKVSNRTGPNKRYK